MNYEVSKNDNSGSTFGDILARERKKRGLSLKELEKIMMDDNGNSPAITASYLNRLENNNKDNPSFKLVCSLCKTLNLDIKEVFKNFKYEYLINVEEYPDLAQLIRLNNFSAPLKVSDGIIKDTKILTPKEKEIIIELLEKVFLYGVSNNDDIVKNLKIIMDLLEEYRHSRMKLQDEEK